jgi:hypothetical protein
LPALGSKILSSQLLLTYLFFYSLLAEFYFGSSIVVLKSSISQNPELNRKEKKFSLEEERGLFAIKMSKGRN